MTLEVGHMAELACCVGYGCCAATAEAATHLVEHDIVTNWDDMEKIWHHSSFPQLKDPIAYGIFTNLDDIEKIWHRILYKELRVTPEGYAVLPTEAPLNPEANRGRMTQTMVETFNVPATHVATQAACVYSFTAASEREIVLDDKKRPCYLGLDYDTEETCGLPDRNIIIVGAKRFRCVEVSFQSNFI